MARKIAHIKKRAFLASFSELGNVSLAAQAADVGRRTHYDWLESDEDYEKAFADAKESAGDALEAEARRRAVEGVRKPVGWHQGKAGGYVQEYSDTLLIFLLKGVRPDKYVDHHKFEVTEKKYVIYASPPIDADEWRKRYAPANN